MNCIIKIFGECNTCKSWYPTYMLPFAPFNVNSIPYFKGITVALMFTALNCNLLFDKKAKLR